MLRSQRGWRIALGAAVAAVTIAGTAPAFAQYNSQGAYGKVIRIDRSGFKPNAGRITFSEKPIGTSNPVYRPSDYGGDSKGITVTFGGFFAGQRMGTAATCQGGGALTGCVVGKPSDPLTIDSSAPATQIATDSASPDAPVLSGTPRHNGPVSMLFEPNVAGVGLQGGFFDALKTTSITAFDRFGRQIGGVVNLAKGIEYMALVTEDGSETIAGLQFSLVGPELNGFAIDNLSFARRGDLQDSVAPARPEVSKNNGGGGGSLADVFGAKPGAPADTPAAPAAPAAPAKSLKDMFK
jgi:hypothetical protein